MPSVTSFFSGALYRKNLSRFWPLWALYGLIWLYLMPLNLLNALLDGRSLRSMVESLPTLLVSLGMGTALIFGVFAAMAVFSYLYSSRSACAMHALPLRREALFLTAWLSGLSFLVLPNAVVALLTLIVGAVGAPVGTVVQVVLTWFLAQSAMCLFFFSFAAFCAMFTGSILALPVFYGILNGLVAALVTLLEGLLQELLYGFDSFETSVHNLVVILTPCLSFVKACGWNVTQLAGGGAVQDANAPVIMELNSPLTLALYALAGLVLTGIALEVYRLRHVESAGDVVSVPVIRPVFRYGFAFCAGLTFGVATAAFFGNWNDPVSLTVFIVLWTVVGCFVAEMFLQRSFRVWKAWKGSAVMAVVMALLCAGCLMDWFGYERNVPDPAQVETVRVQVPESAPYDFANGGTALLTDPEDIAACVQLHQAITDHRDDAFDPDKDWYWSTVTFHYTLQNGRTMHRSYRCRWSAEELNEEGTPSWAAQQLLDRRGVEALVYQFDYLEQSGRLVSASLESAWNPVSGDTCTSYLNEASPAELTELWQAVRADFEEGTIGARYLITDSPERYASTYRTDLCFEFAIDLPEDLQTHPSSELPWSSSTRTMGITLTPRASHTLDWLQSHGVFTEECQPMTWETIG